MDSFSLNLSKSRKLCNLQFLLSVANKMDDQDAIEEAFARLYGEACEEALAAVGLVRMFDFMD